jgi:hypothetical protein
MSDKDPQDPSTTSFAYDKMWPRWALINAVLGGTETMREAGEDYLPMHSDESMNVYLERLSTNVFFNLTELTLESWVGRPFSDPVKKNDDMPDDIKEDMENVDLQGNNLDVFCREWFREGIAKAFSHVLIEFPQLQDRINPATGEVIPRTLADDQAENNRPYWIHIKPENVLSMQTSIIDGVEKTIHVRILEEVVQMNGFAEISIPQIRVLEPGFTTLYQQRKVNGKIVWIPVDQFLTGLDEVPFVTFYTNRDGVGLGKPPLMDLAELNVTHWQSNSDQRMVLTVARFPMLALSGGNEDETKLTIGPRKWLFTPDPQGRYYFVEHSGKAIEAGSKDLMMLVEMMGNYGAAFLKKRPGRETATARALDSAEGISPLQDITVRFMDAVNLALSFHAAWKGNTEGGGTVKLSTDFGPESSNQSDFNVLKFTRRLGDISRDAYLKELKRRGTMSDEYDPEEDMDQIEKEVELGFSKLLIDEEEGSGPGESEIGGTGSGEESDGGGSGASG